MPAPAGDPPPNFPPNIDLYRQAYENWTGEIRTGELWVCAPREAQDVAVLANWAQEQGFSLRPQGSRHGWSPLTVTSGTTSADRVVLVDTTRYLNSITISGGTVRAQAGAAMEAVLTALEGAGLGVTAVPESGNLTVGGVVAINGHGTGILAAGEHRAPGHTFGTVTNLVLSLTAVVWDGTRYVLRTVDRAEPDCAALLSHLGRAFVIEATLRAGANQHLRCVSKLDIPAAELFAAPGGGAGRTLASLVDQAGRVEVIWFVFTDLPWIKMWSVSPTRPLTSRPVTGPYNYVFSDNVPEEVSQLAQRLVNGAWVLTPAFGQTQMTAVASGLTLTAAWDLWGLSKNLLLCLRPTTLRLASSGHTLLTSRANLQRVVHDLTTFFDERLRDYQSRGMFPISGAADFRITGVDDPADTDVSGAVAPALSSARPRADHPDWDVVVWFDMVTFPQAPGAEAFLREVEQFVYSHFSGWAIVRPEWSKGWAYTTEAVWADQTTLTTTIPDAFRGADPSWDSAVATLNALDPHRVFSNPFLDVLLP
jgi:FAD/FMN-containing dehydrogenase